MEKELRLVELYDFYGTLLTEKQQHYFEDYYLENLTLAEISENDGVSRNAVHKTLKEIEGKLELFEGKLGLALKREKIKKLLEKENSVLKDKILDIL